MSGLGEQIAVLDGLAAFEPGGKRPKINPRDGRLGQQRARVDQYGRLIMRDVLARTNVIDPSGGANYSGGSSYAERLPLMPSSIGLAGIPSVLPPKRNVIDPSGGANYTGGSSYAPRMPLMLSSAGLADPLIDGGYGRAGLGLAAALIEGGYGRAGLGAPLIEGGYGRAGLGSTGCMADEDLASAAEAIAVERQATGQMAPGERVPRAAMVRAPRINPQDGRLGQQRARVDQYGRLIMRNVLARTNVIDASGGANYSGGSSYAPRLPLMPSTVGLAGFAGCAPCGLGATPEQASAVLVKNAAALKKVALNNKVPLAYRVACAKKYQALLNELCALRARTGQPMTPRCNAQFLKNIGKEYTARSWA